MGCGSSTEAPPPASSAKYNNDTEAYSPEGDYGGGRGGKRSPYERANFDTTQSTMSAEDRLDQEEEERRRAAGGGDDTEFHTDDNDGELSSEAPETLDGEFTTEPNAFITKVKHSLLCIKYKVQNGIDGDATIPSEDPDGYRLDPSERATIEMFIDDSIQAHLMANLVELQKRDFVSALGQSTTSAGIGGTRSPKNADSSATSLPNAVDIAETIELRESSVNSSSQVRSNRNISISLAKSDTILDDTEPRMQSISTSAHRNSSSTAPHMLPPIQVTEQAHQQLSKSESSSVTTPCALEGSATCTTPNNGRSNNNNNSSTMQAWPSQKVPVGGVAVPLSQALLTASPAGRPAREQSGVSSNAATNTSGGAGGIDPTVRSDIMSFSSSAFMNPSSVSSQCNVAPPDPNFEAILDVARIRDVILSDMCAADGGLSCGTPFSSSTSPTRSPGVNHLPQQQQNQLLLSNSNSFDLPRLPLGLFDRKHNEELERRINIFKEKRQAIMAGSYENEGGLGDKSMSSFYSYHSLLSAPNTGATPLSPATQAIKRDWDAAYSEQVSGSVMRTPTANQLTLLRHGGFVPFYPQQQGGEQGILVSPGLNAPNDGVNENNGNLGDGPLTINTDVFSIATAGQNSQDGDATPNLLSPSKPLFGANATTNNNQVPPQRGNSFERIASTFVFEQERGASPSHHADSGFGMFDNDSPKVRFTPQALIRHNHHWGYAAAMCRRRLMKQLTQKKPRPSVVYEAPNGLTINVPSGNEPGCPQQQEPPSSSSSVDVNMTIVPTVRFVAQGKSRVMAYQDQLLRIVKSLAVD